SCTTRTSPTFPESAGQSFRNRQPLPNQVAQQPARDARDLIGQRSWAARAAEELRRDNSAEEDRDELNTHETSNEAPADWSARQRPATNRKRVLRHQRQLRQRSVDSEAAGRALSPETSHREGADAFSSAEGSTGRTGLARCARSLRGLQTTARSDRASWELERP